ncbi:shufflon system plasmid conjugative transfer pilus tip adhesin PilV [Ralstonia solanacearum]|uniref:shufflon system plasmid conjugative transfer pilus tip adhesin PilV n=1 Tax=Ralstonia pseudosolanacearum TaxID=1310165 RepID=UPI00140407AF|nr:shufflon system plasmid conjugative transfer pilus tip adhesin PilV [Ralstonia pseudosolanacearum]KAF3458131.1 shufflon system plasmid conjugative transfer pilus tip adhesin PilV [Ralstonia solanacearum]NKG01762.1 shufflon system plasmid conjugative transfer pilus tip adhesin PilV [Ralstonia solanacearum]UNJ33173.1 shufflon system plasmid conjugative transfer pilus tip adhesin PilV [Ralstonia pseudosolanacearum]
MDALLGYIVALVLSMLSLAGFTTWAKIGVTNVQTAAVASQMLVFNKAAQQYVQDNAATLVAQATATTPVSVTTATLINSTPPYLPVGFSSTNAFGQTWLLQVLQPSANTLQSLVTTQGGRTVTDAKQLVQIAAQTGAQGGFVPYAGQLGDATMTPTNAYGAFGGWRVSLANYTNPGSGHLASLLAFGGAQVNNNYLYRVQVPGHPELNQMQTALDMTGNDINNIGNANAVQEHLTGTGAPGAVCSDTGAIRTSTSGTGMVICNGTWQPIGIAVANITNGASCSNPGQIATDAGSTGYICRGGKYVLIDNAIGKFAVNRQITNVTDGMTFAKDSCPSGTAWAMYTPGTFLVNDTGNVLPPIEGNLFNAVDQGAVWYAQASGRSATGWYSGNDTGNLGGQLVGTFTTGCQY